MNTRPLLVSPGEETGENTGCIRNLIGLRENKMELVEGARLGVGQEVMWPWMVRSASILGPGVSCYLYGNMDSINPTISVPMRLAAHFFSLKNGKLCYFYDTWSIISLLTSLELVTFC